MKIQLGRASVRSIAIVSGIGASAIFAGFVGARETVPQNAQFQTSLRANEIQLTAIERSFAKIEAARTPAAKDALADGFEREQTAYAKSMQERYSAALAQADLEVKTNGKQGSVAALKLFEDLAQSHEARLDTLSTRGKRMAPAGMAMMWPATVTHVARQEAPAWSPMDLLIPRAQAAIALVVYNACKQPRDNKVCAAAILKGTQDGVVARNTFNACWARYEGTRPKWWRATLRAGCTAALVARLA